MSKKIAKHPLYNSWGNLRQRCSNKKHPRYHRYGGRGIKVCERWNSFDAFVADMGPRPSPGHSIERKNNAGDYEPGNCVWATCKEQNNNRDYQTAVTLDGQTMSLRAWSRRYGLHHSTVQRRVWKMNWSIHKALTTPLMHPRTALPAAPSGA